MPRLAVILALSLGCLSSAAALRAADAELELRVVDKDTGFPTPVRMHLKDARGKPVFPKEVIRGPDHFIFPGTIILELKPGRYTFEVERGPEYRIRTGYFELKKGDADAKQVEMERFAHLKTEGWWSGDLHVHRPPEEIELWMRAEDLHIAPVITWWNDRNLWKDKPPPEQLLKRCDDDRLYHLMAGEDERGGGALLYFNRTKPLPLAGSSREYPSPVQFLKQAKIDSKVHVDIEKPFWWDAPVWLASGLCDSIGLAHNHLWRHGVLDNEAWGKPRDRLGYPPPDGNGRWAQDIYYHALNAGLRIPPSAGSAAGVLPNPVGYNRVYVQVDGELTWEKWWAGLKAGRVFVTNGPLLRPRVNGRPPGHVFTAADGQPVTLKPQLNLAVRERVEYLEVVKNGKVIHEVRLDQYAKSGGRLPDVDFKQSGWMLIRAVTTNQKTFRFASTGPYYVQVGEAPRISKRSCQFFVDWVRQRAERLKLPADQREAVLIYHRAARDFWLEQLAQANAD